MNFKNKRPRVSRASCFCGGKWDKKVTGYEKRKYVDPPDEAKPTPRRKKNRRKWCRGKVGVAHKPRWVPDPDRNLDSRTGQPRKSDFRYEIFKCEVCGKELNWRTIHVPCGESHKGWGHGWYFKNRETGKYERKPFPCEEKAA